MRSHKDACRTPSPPRRLALAAGVLVALASPAAMAGALLGPDLVQRLDSALPTDELVVVVTFEDASPLDAADVALLQAAGIERGMRFHSLPIAGALATPAEVAALAARDEILSIHLNRELEYFNAEARQISGVERLQANPGELGRPIPYTGFGVTAVINDSGIDATHLDLSFGNHVVENVQGLTNLAAWDPALLPVTYLEGQPNTDTNSGHGTHCAGTFGGTGERSGGLYAGVAPGADIVGYGSGGGIAILDALGGFDYAITNQFRFDSPIRVISNSWGSSGPFDPADPVSIASYEAYKRGIVTVFAAGNSGPGEDTHNPYAQAPWVISVGAARKDGSLEPFSSRGKRFESATFTMPDGQQWTYVNEPTIVATGVDVVSTRAATNLAANGADADLDVIAPQHLPFYTMISGTSMATPHVAGIVDPALSRRLNY
jgi:serine protease AprX